MAIKAFPLVTPWTNCGPWGPRGNGMHWGVDLCTPEGSPIVAVDDGTVSYGQDPMGGRVFTLHATDGRAWYHAHASRFEGGNRAVRAGEVLGYVGHSGNAVNGPSHLHIERWDSGQFQRPTTDPTAELLAAPVLPAPLGAPRPWGKWALVAAAVASAAGIGALAWEELRHPGAVLPWRTA